MTWPACFSQPPEGRFTHEREVLSEAVLIRVSLNSDDGIMITCTCERDVLSEVVLIRVSLNILQEPGGGHGMDSFPDGKTLCASMNHINTIQFQIVERRPH